MILKKIGSSLKFYIREISEKPFQTLEDQIVDCELNQLINPIVHQTWVGRKFGKSHYKSLKDFRSLNPDLTFKIYTDANINQYMKENWSHHKIYEVFKNSLIGPLKTDIFRYCILYDRGGYYFDISRGCKIPLKKLHHKNSKMIITYEDTTCFIPPQNQMLYNLKRPFNHFLQWGLAFEKKHKFLELIIAQIVNNYPFYKDKIFSNPKLAILNFTGPGMYTYVMRNYLVKYGLEQVQELDIKFDNNGIFKLNGSQFRYHQVASYTLYKNMKICN